MAISRNLTFFSSTPADNACSSPNVMMSISWVYLMSTTMHTSNTPSTMATCDQSMEEKLKVIQSADLAGVAEWKLGFERASVWPVIAQYLQ